MSPAAAAKQPETTLKVARGADAMPSRAAAAAMPVMLMVTEASQPDAAMADAAHADVGTELPAPPLSTSDGAGAAAKPAAAAAPPLRPAAATVPPLPPAGLANLAAGGLAAAGATIDDFSEAGSKEGETSDDGSDSEQDDDDEEGAGGDFKEGVALPDDGKRALRENYPTLCEQIPAGEGEDAALTQVIRSQRALLRAEKHGDATNVTTGASEMLEMWRLAESVQDGAVLLAVMVCLCSVLTLLFLADVSGVGWLKRVPCSSHREAALGCSALAVLLSMQLVRAMLARAGFFQLLAVARSDPRFDECTEARARPPCTGVQIRRVSDGTHLSRIRSFRRARRPTFCALSSGAERASACWPGPCGLWSWCDR